MRAHLLGFAIMNFDFSDDQKLLKEQVRKFLTDKCPTKVVRRVLDGNETHANGIGALLSIDGQRGSDHVTVYLANGPYSPAHPISRIDVHDAHGVGVGRGQFG